MLCLVTIMNATRRSSKPPRGVPFLLEYVQNDSYDSYQSVSVSIISGVGPTSLQLGLFIHQTRHRTRMQARDELSCMHRVGRRPSYQATSHHIIHDITG